MTTLQDLKKQSDLTNAAVGRTLGVSTAKAGMILQGRYTSTYTDVEIEQLADVLGVTFERCWFAMCENWRRLRAVSLCLLSGELSDKEKQR
jgi:hypothetical protein